MAEAVAQDEVRRHIETLREWIDGCPPGGMVFFGGAGVSTESGIPDFRSTGGLYAQRYPYPPETMVSHSFFEAHPREFFQFYFDRMIAPDVITQNIDGLHQAAGSRAVHELHGSVHRNTCTGCDCRFDLSAIMALHEASSDGVPRCPDCGAIVKPDVVLYEEPLDGRILEEAVRAIAAADLLVVAGTSLVVYPAAGLLQYFSGDHLAIVNLAPTDADRHADLCVPAKVGEVLAF